MNANPCKNKGFEDLIVSYIYDEATADERRRLETHILDCSSCMEEFAGLSNARLSVFEWQRESFSELETPVFSVPQSGTSGENEDGGSIFGALAAWIAGLRGPAIAFAAVLLVLAGGLSFVFLSGRGPAEVAKVNPAEPAAAPVAPSSAKQSEPVPAAVPPAATEAVKKPALTAETAAASESEAEPRAVKAVSSRPAPARQARQLTARAEKPRRVAAPDRKAPVLSDFDETLDRSLMLSDLIDDEVGSIY